MNEVDRPLLEGVLIPDINEKLKIKTIINKLDKFSNNKKKKNDLLLLRNWPPFIWWTPNLVVVDLF